MAHGDFDAIASLAAPSPRADLSVRTSLRKLRLAALLLAPDPASATESLILDRTHKSARGSGPGSGLDLRVHLPNPTTVAEHPLTWSLSRIAARPERPWLAFLGLPLALTVAIDTAGGLDGPGELIALCAPVSFASWWWAPRDDFRWTWLVPIELGVVSVCWSMTGAYALAFWTDSRVVVGVFWAGAAAVLGLVSFIDRRQGAV